MTVYFSIDDSADVLVANPRLISDGENKVVKQNAKIKAVPSNSVVNINGKAIDFDVDWDNATRTIKVNTSVEYTE